MEKLKYYQRTKFDSSTIREAITVFRDRALSSEGRREPEQRYTVQTGSEKWRYDSAEEFFAHYRQDIALAHLSEGYGTGRSIEVWFESDYTTVTVSAEDRAAIEAVFEVFESRLSEAQIPEPEETANARPVIFIGHGRSPLWRDLKDHLHEKHGYQVEAYEIGARAGHAIRDILEEMLEESSMAFLVMTGEDETADGGLRARQNVVHEAGLFQGRLGFSRAIMVVEEGTEAFSNLDGVQQIRFSGGNIREVYGEVLATIRREFGASMD